VLCATVSELDFRAHRGQQVAFGFNIANLRNVFQNDWFFRQKRRRHCRKRSILCAAYLDCPEQGITTANYELIHEC
jgi:hypothetical protein